MPVVLEPVVQDRLPDLLTSSPARYHCATDAPAVTKGVLLGNDLLLSYICYILPYIYIGLSGNSSIILFIAELDIVCVGY